MERDRKMETETEKEKQRDREAERGSVLRSEEEGFTSLGSGTWASQPEPMRYVFRSLKMAFRRSLEAPGKLPTVLCCPRQIDDPLWSSGQHSLQTVGAGAAAGTWGPQEGLWGEEGCGQGKRVHVTLPLPKLP